jgi:hypothetical protein
MLSLPLSFTLSRVLRTDVRSDGRRGKKEERGAGGEEGEGGEEDDGGGEGEVPGA